MPLAGESGLQQTMGAGEGDVSTHRASHQSEYGPGVDSVGKDAFPQRQCRGRMGGENDVEGEAEHQCPQRLGDGIHTGQRVP